MDVSRPAEGSLPSPEEQRNRAAYDQAAAQWAAARSGFFRREEAFLDTLLDGLPPASLILDAGCGSGHPLAGAVLARGHRVLGVDQSVEMLALARGNFPHGRWELCALTDYAFDQTVQGIICWDALFHIPRKEHAPLLARMARSLAPGGRLMLTSGGSEHPAFVDSMFGVEFYYDSHPPERLLELLRGFGLRVVMEEMLNAPTSGRDKGRYAVLARKG